MHSGLCLTELTDIWNRLAKVVRLSCVPSSPLVNVKLQVCGRMQHSGLPTWRSDVLHTHLLLRHTLFPELGDKIMQNRPIRIWFELNDDRFFSKEMYFVKCFQVEFVVFYGGSCKRALTSLKNTFYWAKCEHSRQFYSTGTQAIPN